MLTIKEMQDALNNKKVSSVELTQDCFKKIKDHDKKINSFITLNEEHALQQAKTQDEIRNKSDINDKYSLAGIPIGLKDIFCTKDLLTTCGSKMLHNFKSPYSATLVKHLANAGCVFIGKNNMDEFAMGSSNETSYFGKCHNPWDISKVPGGSSGGSAAAVASGMVPASIGTDTGGSIRQPAAFCNLVGLKPTYGRVSRYGMIAFASSLDQAGPLARTAYDAALILQSIAKHDPLDSTSTNIKANDYISNIDNPLKGLKIGIPKEFLSENLDTKIAKHFKQQIKKFESLGCSIVDISLPNSKYAVQTYYIVAPAECSANLARFDGIRYGYRAANCNSLQDVYMKSRTEGFGKEVQRRIMIGTYVLSAGYYDAYYIKAQKCRRLIQQDYTNAFETVDMILSPTTPELPFNFNTHDTDPIQMYLSDLYTVGVNLAGLPAINVPSGFIDNLPVGIQLIAPNFQEGLLLNAAHKFQQEIDCHLQTPVL